MDNISGFVSHDLGFNVSRLQNQLLDKDASVAESLLGFRSERIGIECYDNYVSNFIDPKEVFFNSILRAAFDLTFFCRKITKPNCK